MHCHTESLATAASSSLPLAVLPASSSHPMESVLHVAVAGKGAELPSLPFQVSRFEQQLDIVEDLNLGF